MAVAYKFSLEKLLEIREDREEESKRKFSKSKEEKMKTEEELNNLKDSYNKYKGIKPGEDVIYQKIKRNYLFALQGGIKNKEKELVIKSRELEVRRLDLKEKQKDRKTVSRLKEKKCEEFIKEQNRIEQINNDEFALYGYIRNNLKGGEKK
ncbi:MAG: flagellar export protein FliJ [Clostridiales bacterium]|nr:flagellar export protein FliJ [Clostridiales bacterium]